MSDRKVFETPPNCAPWGTSTDNRWTRYVYGHNGKRWVWVSSEKFHPTDRIILNPDNPEVTYIPQFIQGENGHAIQYARACLEWRDDDGNVVARFPSAAADAAAQEHTEWWIENIQGSDCER